MQITASCAVSLDGYLDHTSDTRLILSSDEDFKAVHQLRSECDAVCIGAETLRRDNPSLTARLDNKTLYPVKVVFTQSGNISYESKFFTDGDNEKVIFVAGQNAKINASKIKDQIKNLNTTKGGNISVYAFNDDLNEPLHILKTQHAVQHMLIEGGPSLLSAFFEAGVVQRFRLAISPLIISDKNAPHIGPVYNAIKLSDKNLRLVSTEQLGHTGVMIYDLT